MSTEVQTPPSADQFISYEGFRIGPNSDGIIDSFRPDSPELGRHGQNTAESLGSVALLDSLSNQETAPEPISRMSAGEFGYGNEQERLDGFKRLSFNRLKQKIIAMNRWARKGKNDAPGLEAEGFTRDGRYAVSERKVPHIYPGPEDYMDVLEYGFKKAQEAEDVQDAALIMSSAIVASHPFNDGNGRTSRVVYGELSAGITPDNEAFDMLNASTKPGDLDIGARSVDIGSFARNNPDLYSIAVDAIYRRGDITRFNGQFTGLNFDRDEETGRYLDVTNRMIEGLSPSQISWLDDVYANLRGLNFDRTQIVDTPGADPAFRYAISSASEKFPGFLQKFRVGNPDVVGNAQQLDVEAVLNSGNIDFVKAIADGAREFYKQYAMSIIDMVGGDLSNELIDAPGGGKMTVKNRIIETSNNFLSENIQDHASWQQTLDERFRNGNKKRPQASITVTGDSKRIPLTDFRGDPRRVLGHPSNPTNDIASAFANERRKGLETRN